MTDSISKIIERIMLIIVCMAGPALFFLLSRASQKEVFAEELSRDFLEAVASAGGIRVADYMVFRDGLAGIDGFETRLDYTTYHTEPVYGYYGRAGIEAFFSGRNRRDTYYSRTTAPDAEDADPSALRMQRDTNARVLARLMDEGLPLGNDIPLASYTYEAFVPVQELYAGEYIATVLKVDTGRTVYYTEGDLLPATGSGVQSFRLSVGGVPVNAYVSAVVWPRQITCRVCGNRYTCTDKVVEYYRENGIWAYCPYCRTLVKDITADYPSVTVPVGTKEADITGITFTAEYYDGTTETLALSGLSHNYSPGYAGEQEITVSYKGYDKAGICKIITECPPCTGCGARITDRNAADCRLYPLCPGCMEGIPVFLGECAVIPETFPDSAVTDQLLKEGVFPMGRNDYLELTVNHGAVHYGGKYSFLAADKDIYFRMGRRVRRTGGK